MFLLEQKFNSTCESVCLQWGSLNLDSDIRMKSLLFRPGTNQERIRMQSRFSNSITYFNWNRKYVRYLSPYCYYKATPRTLKFKHDFNIYISLPEWLSFHALIYIIQHGNVLEMQTCNSVLCIYFILICICFQLGGNVNYIIIMEHPWLP